VHPQSFVDIVTFFQNADVKTEKRIKLSTCSFFSTQPLLLSIDATNGNVQMLENQNACILPAPNDLFIPYVSVNPTPVAVKWL
jgi:hypothetical protein